MRVKYNVKGVERGAGLKLVKGGVYGIKVVEAPVAQPEGKGPRIELKAVINDKVTNGGEFDGIPLRTYYVNLDRDDLAWKVAAVVDSFGLKDNGTLDDKTLVGKVARARVKSKMDDEWGPQNEIAALLPPDEDADEEEDADVEEQEEAEVDEADEEESDFTWSDLLEMDRDGLKGFIKDAELGTLKDLGITKSTTDEEIQDLIAEQLEMGERPSGDEEEEEEPEPEEEEEPEANEEPEEEEAEDDGLDALSRADLKKRLKEANPEFVVKRSHTDDDLRAAIREVSAAAVEPEAPDYNAMSVGDLRTLARERGLSDKGGKDVLVKRLKKDDEPF